MTTTGPRVDQYLKPTAYVDSEAANIRAFAARVAGAATEPLGRAVALYHAVRDQIVYTPYCDFRSLETYRASACLARGSGFCVAKSALLAAAARAVGVPARLGFADVRNHLASPRLRRLMGTDLFYYHGYAELYLGGAWVKATPVFDRGLCERFGVPPLPFDGLRDSPFQAYDPSGRRHMEYVRDHGPSADVPAETIIEIFERHYPALTARGTAGPAEGFRDEAAPMA